MNDWTPDRIAALSTDQIKSFRKNAFDRGAVQIVEMCDSELLRRAPAKRPPTLTGKKKGRRNDPVIGYHFVCRPEEKGVIRNSDGTVWSGTWVVAEVQAEHSLRAGAYVALHLSHAEPSYLQGTVQAWRRTKREDEYAEGQKVKTSIGTDFLLQLTDSKFEWRGEGTVERSYVYASDVAAKD